MSSQEPVNRVEGTSSASSRQAQIQKAQALGRIEGLEIIQCAMEDLSTERTEDAIFNPIAQLKKAETLDQRLKKHESKSSSQTDESNPEIVQVDSAAESASEFQNRNQEMQKRI